MSKPFLTKKGGSPFWYAGWYDPIDKKQISPRSTREKIKAKAVVIANQMYREWVLQKGVMEVEKKNLTITQAFAEFAQYKRSINESLDSKTVRNYKQALKNFTEAIGDIPVREVNKSHYIEFVNYLTIEKEYANNTKSIYTSKLKALFNWCLEMELVEKNYFKKIREDEPEARIIPKEHVDLLLETSKDFQGGRFYNLFMLMLLLGLRVSEACNLRWKDVYPDKVIVKGKMSKVATIPFTPRIKDFFGNIPRGKEHEKVVPGAVPKYTYDILSILEKQHGIKLGNHDLRTYRLSQLANYLTPKQLQIFARHSSFKTTYAYYVNSTTEHIVQNATLADQELP